jgi:5-methylcytosine-specific restriction endonuclease McrBC regulatory subunit McrC
LKYRYSMQLFLSPSYKPKAVLIQIQCMYGNVNLNKVVVVLLHFAILRPSSRGLMTDYQRKSDKRQFLTGEK